ncbi:Aldehyde/histidinol dehydrogenase [Paraphoma chrysanthemicola]|uniref:aldehyde dehydrogenase (NAD(+)) n=1 Tax=Paraphoma chrysanthemicola TaxID=798071 RepID=A0A8K0QTZ1_9PLEO|nr:Aldehyde/histidinol dehydrogenase [Paraphoma chrysanthemicola]
MSSPKLLSGSFSHIINGKAYDAKGAKTLDVINPATEEVIASVPIATRAVLDEAVDYSQKAFESWSKTTWQERAKLVEEVGKEWKTISKDLAELLVHEQGKASAFAQGEVDLTNEWFERMPKMEIKEKVVWENDESRAIEQYVPLGVTAGIVPWNFPVLLMVWKIIPAVLTGNTIIIKPSPFTPLCDVRIVELFNKYLPPGVVQIVLGDDNLGPWVTEHPRIRKISFTGSTATGRLVAKSCSATLKRFTLELGGNDACIVLPDIDVEKVAPTILLSAFFNSGQVCHAAKRIYVHEDIYDKVSKALVEAAKQAGVGPGNKEGVMYGPLNNRQVYEKVSEFFAASQKDGHDFLTGGQIPDGTGFFAPLTLVNNPPENSRLVQEEPFGPIVPLLKWKDDQDLLKRVNDSNWGLGATIYGKDLARVEKLARQVEAGVVWTNTMMQQHPEVPFGGFKGSGVGCENGEGGLKGWCQVRSLYLSKA